MRQRIVPIGLGWACAAIIWLQFVPGTLVQAQQLPAPGQLLSPGQLDDLVAPIALYPDPLISQILVASTYPLEIVEASQWLLRNPNLSGTAMTQAVQRQDWDPSVQALAPFPDILKYLTEDIAWTTNLGNVFLDQEADVMDAIQRMRARAVQSGKLVTSPQQQVTRVYDSGEPVYVIVPTDPDIIYVPVYDPLWIWGPPAYYPYARWYYPPYAQSLFFNRGISLQFYYGPGWQNAGWTGWNSWGWRPGWSSHNVIVNNTFIQRQYSSSIIYPNRSGTTNWSHDVSHRQGVPYPNPTLTERFRSNQRENLGSHQVSGRDRVGSPTPVTPAAPRSPAAPRTTERFVSNDIAPAAANRDTLRGQNVRGNPNPVPAQANSNSRSTAPLRPAAGISARTPDVAPAPGPAQGWTPAQRQAQSVQRQSLPASQMEPQRQAQSVQRQSLPASQMEPQRQAQSVQRQALPASQMQPQVRSQAQPQIQSMVRETQPARTAPSATPSVRQQVPAQARESASAVSSAPSRAVPAQAQQSATSHGAAGGGRSRGRD